MESVVWSLLFKLVQGWCCNLLLNLLEVDPVVALVQRYRSLYNLIAGILSLVHFALEDGHLLAVQFPFLLLV